MESNANNDLPKFCLTLTVPFGHILTYSTLLPLQWNYYSALPSGNYCGNQNLKLLASKPFIRRTVWVQTILDSLPHLQYAFWTKCFPLCDERTLKEFFQIYRAWQPGILTIILRFFHRALHATYPERKMGVCQRISSWRYPHSPFLAFFHSFQL